MAPPGRGAGPGGPPGEGPTGDGAPGDGPASGLRPTGHAPLAVLAAIGLVVGWSARLISLRAGWPQPQVTWPAVVLLGFVAVALLATAVLTRRVVRRDRARLDHRQAVNRLLLGKACALVGALLLGGYLGYALAQLGVATPAAQERLVRSLVAALTSAVVVTGALLLEHACRVPDPEE